MSDSKEQPDSVDGFDSSNCYTPKSWEWLCYPDGRKLLTGTNNAVIHCPGPGPQIGISEPDMSLIAAAPDLLEALKACHDHLDGCSHGYPDELWAQVEAAITKAGV